MSGIALIFRRDGAPVAGADLEAMTAAMDHRAVDGVRHEIDGPIGVGFCSMVTTPEARGERQPLRCRGGSTIVAMDGRIDDRRTLLARLGRRIDAAAGDAELLAHAVERWGAGFVNHLIGDFAVVVADVAQRRVLCARDHLGVKPIYYASVGPLFVAASEVRGVLAHPAVPAELDPASFDQWAQHWVIPDGTVYRSIKPVPMGSTVVVTPNGLVSPSRFWTPACRPSAPPSPDDLVEEYRALLAQATADRLRSTGPVVVAMSGGLDSTTVAATAAALTGRAGGADLRISSLVYPGHPRPDESPLIDSMERHLGIPVRRTRPRPRTPAQLAAEIERYADLPDPANDQLSALVHPELGERVLLTGLGGDDWYYAPSGLEIARAVRRGRPFQAIRAARVGRADASVRGTGRALWRYGLRPLPKLPGAVVARSPLLSDAATFAGRGFARRLLRASERPRGVPVEAAPVLAWSRNPLLGGRFALTDRRAAHHGFELRHPLHDVRLVELSLRLPDGLRSLEGDGRWLPRRAVTDLLPAVVRLRREKAEFSLTLREELELASADGVLERAAADGAVRPGSSPSWLDPPSVSHSWRALGGTDKDASSPQLAALWAVAVAQIWQESVHAGHVNVRVKD